MLTKLEKNKDQQIPNQVLSQLNEGVWDLVWAESITKVLNQVWYQVRNEIFHQFKRDIKNVNQATNT